MGLNFQKGRAKVTDYLLSKQSYVPLYLYHPIHNSIHINNYLLFTFNAAYSTDKINFQVFSNDLSTTGCEKKIITSSENFIKNSLESREPHLIFYRLFFQNKEHYFHKTVVSLLLNFDQL